MTNTSKKSELSDEQIGQWISIKQVAWCLLGESGGELDSCDDCSWCIFRVKHVCFRNLDSPEIHHIELRDTSWNCERGKVRKMIAINNTPVELVMAVRGGSKQEAIDWINRAIDRVPQ